MNPNKRVESDSLRRRFAPSSLARSRAALDAKKETKMKNLVLFVIVAIR